MVESAIDIQRRGTVLEPVTLPDGRQIQFHSMRYAWYRWESKRDLRITQAFVTGLTSPQRFW